MKSGCRICSLETSSQSPHKCSWKDNPHSVQQPSNLHPSLQVHSLEQQRALGGAGLGMSSSMRAGSAISPFLSSSDPTAFESKGSLAGEVAADEADLLGEIEVRALLCVRVEGMGEVGGREKERSHLQGYIHSRLASFARYGTHVP